jgi:hypothetical protein
MSGRSSPHSVVALGLALVACGKSAPAQPPPPEIDPGIAVALARQMLQHAPTAGAVDDCKPGQLTGGLSMTQVTLLKVGMQKVADDPEHAAWINPPDLDGPAAQTMATTHGGTPERRQAAAQFMGAPFYVVYRVDNVDAPMALGLKELKIGTIGGRAIRYEKSGLAGCVTVFTFQDDQAVSDQAIAESDKTLIDPKVVDRLRKDLAAQYLKHAPR